ncbi:MAG: hypothetical protein Q8942_04335, partial [Bacillota bacterium]|nr:hypothetical protein [Bacillota bacterium]
KGNIVSYDDIDAFKFTTTKAGVYRFIRYDYGFSICLYDEAGIQVYPNEFSNNNDYNLEKNKMYYIKVLNASSTTSYKFMITEPKEDEYGDTKETAKELSIGENINGSIYERSDVDFFSFKSEKEGIYRLKEFKSTNNDIYTMQPSAGQVLNICGKNNDRVNYWMDSKNTIYFKLKSNEMYYISINGMFNAAYVYDYSFKFEGPMEDDIGNDEETSKEIKLEDKIKGSMDYFSDYDYFKFVPTMDGTYLLKNFSVDLQNDSDETPEMDKIVTVYGYYLSDKISYEKDGSMKISLLKGKTYYIIVSNTNYSYPLFNYSIDLEGPLEDDCGNEIETAKEISMSSKINGQGDYAHDLDFFKVNVNAGAYYIDDFVQTAINDFKLSDIIKFYDENRNEIYSKVENNKLIVYMSKPSTLFISVASGDSPLLQYSFSVKGPIEDDCGNTPETAKQIDLNAPFEAVGNYLGDCDCFSFIPSMDGTYLIEDLLQNSGIGTTDNVYIVDSNSTVLNIDKYNSNYYVNLQKDKKYYLRVTFPESNTKFSFNIKGPQTDDYGNDMQSASEIKIGSKIDGKTEFKYDKDFFKLRVDKDGAYCLDNYNTSTSDYNSQLNRVFKLYDSTGNSVKVVYDYGYNRAYFQLKKDMVYYMSIECTYLSFDYSFSVNGPLSDDYGNSKDEANELQLNKKTSGKVEYLGDYDYFKFTPDISGTFCLEDISMEFSNNLVPDFGFVMSVEDSEDNEIGMNLSNKPDYNKIYLNFVRGKTYYICLDNSKTNNYFDYSFTLKGPDLNEIGNDISNSKTIELGTKYNSAIDYYGDVDMFNFTTKSKGIYTITYDGMFSESPISVFDKSGNQIKSFSIKTDERKKLYFLPENETCYIKVEGYNDYSVLVEGPTPDDYTNIPDNCPLLRINSPLSGVINYLEDVDIFGFTPVYSGKYYFALDFGYINSLDIYDTDNKYCANQRLIKNENNTKIVDAELEANKTYYIKVTNFDSNSIDKEYKLTVNDNMDQLLSKTCTIMGYIKPEFINYGFKAPVSGFVVKVTGSGQSAVTDENGYFEIPDVSKSDMPYNVEISRPGYLKRVIDVTANKDIMVSTKDSPVQMWAGDIDQDGIVNMMDVMKIAKLFNKTVVNESADLDGNSVVNLADVMILARYFVKTSKDYPEYASR